MALEEALKCVSAEAGADLSADQYKAVKMDADGQVTLCNAIGQRMYGILQDNPDAIGRAACVGVFGISKMIAAAAIDAGEEVATDALGLGIVSIATNMTIGIAETSAAIGDIFSVLIGVAQTPA